MAKKANTKSFEQRLMGSLDDVVQSWVARAKTSSKTQQKSRPGAVQGRIVVVGKPWTATQKRSILADHPDWKRDWIENSSQPLVRLHSSEGPTFLLRLDVAKKLTSSEVFVQEERASQSPYSLARDMAGDGFRSVQGFGCDSLCIDFWSCSSEQIVGTLVGLELASYQFRSFVKGKPKSLPQLLLLKDKGVVSKAEVHEAASLASGVNLARHLVNLPPQALHPESYSDFLKSYFSKKSHMSVEVWNEARLRKEGMGLLLAVGEASEHASFMVHLKYRPPGSAKKKPIAFVGKGVTFDSGGLDIKPSRAMRLMKKDMGGSAAVAGLAHWAVNAKLNQPCDFYFAIAENSVSGSSFAPGDILEARSGITVEIHNTDAEGRLVMADVLDVAATKKGKDEPETIIDVATLTGAVKVGLGTGIGGLLSNRPALARKIEKSSSQSGDLLWHLPMMQSYRRSMGSRVADVTNAVDGFGGTITAALFLEMFVRGKAWAHLDIYAWKDGVEGAFSEPGGSGQAVQCLAKYLHDLK